MRPIADPYAPKFASTVLLAVVSLGVIPLVTLPSKLRNFAARERDQLWHFAQWMRTQFGSGADELDPRTPALDSAMHVLRLISWVCALIALGAILWFMSMGADAIDLMHVSYDQFGDRYLSTELTDTFFKIWMTSLCIGYVAQWAAVQVHQTRIKRF